MQQTTELMGNFKSLGKVEVSDYSVDWAWIVKLAQSCERLWNEQGREAARCFAQQNADLPTLRAALSESGELVRTKTLHLMSLWDSPEVITDLSRALLEDPCPVVRHEAAYFLGTTHEAAALDALGTSMLRDSDELVRHEAAEAVGELGLTEGLAWLEQARSDNSLLVRRTVDIAETYIRLNNSRH